MQVGKSLISDGRYLLSGGSLFINRGAYIMKKQCECCYKRFEVVRNTDIPLNPDLTAPQDHIYCPWCGAENGTVEKGSLVKTERCNAECEF